MTIGDSDGNSYQGRIYEFFDGGLGGLGRNSSRGGGVRVQVRGNVHILTIISVKHIMLFLQCCAEPQTNQGRVAADRGRCESFPTSGLLSTSSPGELRW